MINRDLSGTYTAIITPFRDGSVDYATLEKLVEAQVKAGVDGIVAVGTTGESPTLSTPEHLEVIARICGFAAGRVKVIAGTGANSTEEALHLTREADAAGADGFLQVAPYYNKPSQEGIYQHFAAIAQATEKPIMLYSVPARCGVAIGVETVARLAERFEHVRSIKEAGGDVARVSALLHRCGDAVTVLCGDDGLTVPFIAAGARGVVSVASNLAPALITRITNAALDDNFAAARSLALRYHELLTDLVFLEGNPATIKEAMLAAGQIDNAEMRLPLVRISEAARARVVAIVERLRADLA